MKAILRHIKNDWRKIIRFIIAGGFAAFVEASTFIVLHRLTNNVLLANTLSFLCGLIISFSMNKLWVFSHKGNVSRQFMQYILLAAFNLMASNGMIWVLTNKLSTPPIIAKLTTMTIIAFWNYLYFSKYIFKKTHIDI